MNEEQLLGEVEPTPEYDEQFVKELHSEVFDISHETAKAKRDERILVTDRYKV